MKLLNILKNLSNKIKEVEGKIPSGGSITLLWTNPSPSAQFSPQTISVNMAGYDMVCIRFRCLYNGTYYLYYYSKPNDIIYPMSIFNPFTPSAFARLATLTTTTIQFGNCTRYGLGSGSETYNYALVPANVYGIKY